MGLHYPLSVYNTIHGLYGLFREEALINLHFHCETVFGQGPKEIVVHGSSFNLHGLIMKNREAR